MTSTSISWFRVSYSKKSSVFTLCLVFFPLSFGFRAPDNVANNVALPKISKGPRSPPLPEPLISHEQNEGSEEDLNGRHAVVRKRWGVDNKNGEEYWYNARIHTLGNIGFWGAIHAALAPLSTKIIDIAAYEGQDVRQLVANELALKVTSSKAKVVDLCCGVGISTRALRNALPEAETVIGVDTSPQMISMAKFLSQHLSVVKPWFEALLVKVQNCPAGAMPVCKGTTFARGNAEKTELPGRSFDLVTVMYAFHEAPKEGRARILREARRLLSPGGTLAVIDISTGYTPSATMLAGEPYVLEYQKNIHQQLRSFRGFAKVTYKSVVPDHVGMWVLKRNSVA